MELDFSRLNKLPFQTFDTAEQEEAPEVPKKAQRAQNRPDEIKVQEQAKKPTEAPTELNSVATAKLNVEKENQRKLNEMYGAYSENRAKANAYIAQLLKGVKAGEPTAKLLLTACKCISAMTGEKVFYEQIEGDIKAIYGEALLEPAAIKISLEDAQKRLQKLQEARQREGLTPDEKKRIDSAIKAHKAKVEHLGALDIDTTLDIMF